MKLFIVGDTHGGIDAQKLYSKNFPNYKTCSKEDILLHLGDFGYIWYADADKHKKSLKSMELTFSNRTWGKTLITLGNHENYNLLEQYPTVQIFGGNAVQLTNDVFALMRGEIYTINNLKFLSIGGASSIDKLSRVPNITWFEQENLSYKDISNTFDNLNKHNFKVDYILSHTCSTSSLSQLSKIFPLNPILTDSHNIFFEELKNIVDYKHWYFGHFHIDHQLNPKETSVFNIIHTIE